LRPQTKMPMKMCLRKEKSNMKLIKANRSSKEWRIFQNKEKFSSSQVEKDDNINKY
jgi:hypothetical protein